MIEILQLAESDFGSPAERAELCERAAAECLVEARQHHPADGPAHAAFIAEAQALATLGQSYRLRGCEEWLGSIRDDGVGVG